MRSIASISLVFCVYGLASQNWNVFNGNYRYNYKYNNSALISQVIFSDSLSVQGNDTVYYLNRIGVECVGTCPTLTTPLNPTTTVIVPNMPQFLQRSIKKFPNGTVLLYDTAKLVIQTNCQVNQTWLFDSVNNINATCLNKIVQINFGLSDSVRTILIGNNDTLKLSKYFGLLQFPTLYNQNKYYRLVGIENAGSYDSVALYGVKVPNYYDFYKFNAGDKFCFETSWYMILGSGGNVNQGCYTGNHTILSRTLENNGSYSYSISGYRQNCGAAGVVTTFTLQPTNSNINYENTMYPGQVVKTQFHPQHANLVQFGMDNNGIFYKYAGPGCITYSPVLVPFSYAHQSLESNTPLASSYYTINPNAIISVAYGTGLGQLYYKINPSGLNGHPDQHYFFCTTCAVKNGVPYFGIPTYVGLPDNLNGVSSISVYPNPGSGRYTIQLKSSSVDEIRIMDVLGRNLVYETSISGTEHLELDLSSQSQGLYLIGFYQKGQLFEVKKIMKE